MTSTPQIITANQLACLFLQGVLRWPTRDTQYALPAVDWLLGEFADYYRAEMKRLGISQWSPEDNDCDNFADEFCVAARRCKARMKLGDKSSLAVGYCEIWANYGQPPGWHSVVWTCTGPQALVLIDPYPDNIRILSRSDYQLIRFAEI